MFHCMNVRSRGHNIKTRFSCLVGELYAGVPMNIVRRVTNKLVHNEQEGFQIREGLMTGLTGEWYVRY